MNRQGVTKKDFSFPLQKALFARLQSGSLVDLNGKAVAVRDFTKPDKLVAFPYVTVGDETTDRPEDDKMTSAEQVTANIHIWSQYGGTREAAYIGSQVETLITGQPIDLSQDGLLAYRLMREFGNTLKEMDGLTVHRVLRFRVWIQDTTPQTN